uniref:(northern house mosquito) hypothetical protein n=1 Tax=Culex pipiens TaxID=7175 RepID=A0A8D8BG37_CULPI
MLLNVEATTFLLLFLRFLTQKSRNVTTFAPCSGHTGMTAAHDTHVFTVQHSRRVSGVQNSSTAWYEKSSHFCSRTLFSLTRAHTNTHFSRGQRYSERTHFNLLSHMPATHARDTYCASATQNIHTSASSSLFALLYFSQNFCHCLVSLPLSFPSLFFLPWPDCIFILNQLTTHFCDLRRLRLRRRVVW